MISLKFLFLTLVIIIAHACGTPSKNTHDSEIAIPGHSESIPLAQTLTFSVDANSNINPDANGRPSPLYIKLFFFKNANEFDSAQYEEVFDNDKSSFKQSLVKDFIIRPKTKVKFVFPKESETRFIGIAAAYYNIEHSQWKTFHNISDTKKYAYKINLDRSSINVIAE